jgi:hypothetical protein
MQLSYGGGVRWGLSMAWERGSVAPMARRHERRRWWHRWLGEGGRKGKGGTAWWAGSACLAARGQLGGWAGWPLGRKLKKISFLIKIEFLNMPRLWKFAQGDL